MVIVLDDSLAAGARLAEGIKHEEPFLSLMSRSVLN